MNTTIGLFFGSFNPIHLGHLIIARYALEFTDLSEVWFIISPHNPFKEKKTLLADHHRYYMVNLAVEDFPRLKASNIEFNMPQPSYTINTLTYLHEKYPDKRLVLLTGSDVLPTFHKWKNYEQILTYYELYVYPRPYTEPHPYVDHPKVRFIDAPMMEISSSFIRESIAKGKNVSFLLPDKVYRHLTEMHFYEKKPDS
ncbi:MAG TPA: nicotinate (nicotinamide) nucleotide adenylyltransferase [Bacteroidales bacterium]|nr:nicotinate (nicotinamide) nucleotide adenylyltransferase [Bacteroidales bacterium]HNS47288.1 nicotinate (nicotinamide) nucleotide adenylyltransferase [Bacteroidales bacterium]